jgi:hypothetical protein
VLSKSPLEQQIYLQRDSTRKVFGKMEDDTISMIPHRDSESFQSCFTGTSITSSKRSIIFNFDPELFSSWAYERWIRGSVRESLRKQQGQESLRRTIPFINYQRRVSRLESKLRNACEKGDFKLVKRLLEKGPNVDEGYEWPDAPKFSRRGRA